MDAHSISSPIGLDPASTAPPGASVVPDAGVPLWAWALAAAALAVMYFVMLENGALLGHAAHTLHEFFHDGRHFVGVPCH